LFTYTNGPTRCNNISAGPNPRFRGYQNQVQGKGGIHTQHGDHFVGEHIIEEIIEDLDWFD